MKQATGAMNIQRLGRFSRESIVYPWGWKQATGSVVQKGMTIRIVFPLLGSMELLKLAALVPSSCFLSHPFFWLSLLGLLVEARPEQIQLTSPRKRPANLTPKRSSKPCSNARFFRCFTIFLAIFMQKFPHDFPLVNSQHQSLSWLNKARLVDLGYQSPIPHWNITSQKSIS